MQAADILCDALENGPRSREQLISALKERGIKVDFNTAIRRARELGIDIRFDGRPGPGKRGAYVLIAALPKGIVPDGDGYRYRVPYGKLSEPAPTLDEANQGLAQAWL